MKWWIFLLILLVAIAVPAAMYFYQKRRQMRVEKTGVAVYATVVKSEPVKMFGRPQPILNITLWVQQPGVPEREVKIRSRVPEGQKIQPGMKLAVVIDPADPKRVYPAGPEAAKRIVYTGSRAERRQMKARRM